MTDRKRSKSITYGPIISRLGVIISIFAVGLLILFGTDPDIQKLALSIIIVGFIIASWGYVLFRLGLLGAGMFAAGAIFTTIGFALIAIPLILIAYAMGPSLNVEIILFVSGGVLILLGFFSEQYDLNQKVIDLVSELSELISDFMKRINWGIVFSPVNLLSVGAIYLLVDTPGSPESIDSNTRIILAICLFNINIAWFFRREIIKFFKISLSWIKVLLIFLKNGVKQLKPISIKALKIFSHVISFAKEGFNWLVINNWTLMILLGLLVIFWSSLTGLPYSIRLATGILAISVGISFSAFRYKTYLASIFRSGRSRAYIIGARYSNWRAPKEDLFSCVNCGYQVHPDVIPYQCFKCKFVFEKDMISRRIMRPDDIVAKCASCEYYSLATNWDSWLKIKPNCAHCKTPTKITDLKFAPYSNLYTPEQGKKDFKTSLTDAVRDFVEIATSSEPEKDKSKDTKPREKKTEKTKRETETQAQASKPVLSDALKETGKEALRQFGGMVGRKIASEIAKKAKKDEEESDSDAENNSDKK